MSKIDPANIKKLREMTGAGFMDVKSALDKAKNDMTKASQILRLKGQAKAVKKADRETSNGLIETYVHTGKIGVMLEINCETDFVARTDDFKDLAHDLSMHIAAANPKYIKSENIEKPDLENERKLILKEVEQQTGAKKEHIEKIVEGKLNKYFEQVCLYDQPFVKDPQITIEKLIVEKIAKFGENIVISRFVRYELGEK